METVTLVSLPEVRTRPESQPDRRGTLSVEGHGTHSG
jgi:hypothetical protein